ncbi:Carbamate kinase 2 [Phycisphaerae bacterium RAS1]|nr:Carbamate kinase 2 [Phycisphaerae bacterium RAS1]
MSSADPLVVVALGGNAISPPHAEGNIPEQFAATRAAAVRLADVAQAGYRLLITHGNGPQVGNVLRRAELASREVYMLPLEICVADTQAGMGYMIAQCLNNELQRRGDPRRAGAIVTCVEVDPNDPAFANPTKPIGRPYTALKAEEFRRAHGWRIVETSRGRFRRVVASPSPRAIVEIDLIRELAERGRLLVVGGGGGIPVVRGDDGRWSGIEAVIDKDRTSALLARLVGADVLLIATEVEQVALDFGKPSQRFLERLTVAEARRYRAAGQFPDGSMGPKVEAAAGFVEESTRPGARALICHLDRISEALSGNAGTQICR